MALILNEEQVMLRDSARDFLNTRAPVSHHRELRDLGNNPGFSLELWDEMAEMGWPSILIPEQYGGLDYGYTGLGLVLEECGRTLTPSPMISTALMATTAILLGDNPALSKDWLPGIAGGQRLLSMAFEESSRHRPAAVATSASPVEDDFRISGIKTSVIDGESAHAFIVSTRTRPGESPTDGISLFLVPADADGVHVESTRLLDNRLSCQLTLNDVMVSRGQLLGPLHEGYPILRQTLDRGRAGMAAEMLGIARETFERTMQYLKERQQFGVPIGVFQALQHRAAVLFGEIELCKSVVLKALQAIDNGDPDVGLLASLAKAKCGQTACLATAEGIQMHGGIGMTDAFDIGFFIKRWRSLSQQLGDERYHLDRFARLRGY